MKSFLNTSYALVLLFMIGLTSCGSDQMNVKDSDLIGRWEVYKCERGGKPTQTLDGAYFEFTENNQLFTNFTGEGIMAGYNVYNNEIVQQTGMKIRYKIEAYSEEKMTLSANIRNVDFLIDLVKTSSL